MAHVGEQRATLLLIDLEPLDHRVEAAHELADRAEAAFGDVDTDRVVAVLDATGGFNERVERGGVPAQPSAQTHEGGHGHEHHDDRG